MLRTENTMRKNKQKKEIQSFKLTGCFGIRLRESLLEIKLGKALNAESIQMTMRRTFSK